MWIFLFVLIQAAFAIEALDPDLKTYPYPFEVKFKEVEVHNVVYQMAYMDVPPLKSNGKTVVLLHGKNFSGAYWEKTARDLMKEGFRVIMPDQIGFGKSSKPDSFPYSIHYLAQLTRELLTDLKVKEYSIVGHSMGGMIATRVALSDPTRVEKLILVNPLGLEDWKRKISYKSVDELYKAELLTTEESIRHYQKENYFAGKWEPAYEKQIEILAGWTKHKDYPRIAWTSALTTDMIWTQPVVYEFSDLKVPTLLIIGTRDSTALGKAWADPKIKAELGNYAVLGKEVQKRIPNSKLVEIPDVGHMPQVEAYETFYRSLTTFLR